MPRRFSSARHRHADAHRYARARGGRFAYARHRRARRRWGLRRRLTFAFAFVALAAVLLTTFLTLSAVVGVRRELLLGGGTGATVPAAPWAWWWHGASTAQPAAAAAASAGPGAAGTRDAFGTVVHRAFVAALLAFLLASVAAAVVTRFLTRPLVALTAGARRLAEGERGLRLRVPAGHDELSVLTGAFNQLTEGLERQEAWRRDMVADVAHDLRTPIAVLQSELEAMQDGVRQPDAAGLARLHGEVRMLSRLVEDLRTLSALEVGAVSLRRARAAVLPLLERARDTFSVRAAGSGAALTLEAPAPTLAATVDADRVVQMLGNLLDNALRHAPGAPMVLGATPSGDGVELWVRDHGPGLVAGTEERVFERFYRADPARSRSGAGTEEEAEPEPEVTAGRARAGSGLGLAIVKALAEAHGGWAHAGNHPEGGAVFTVWLPGDMPEPGA